MKPRVIPEESKCKEQIIGSEAYISKVMNIRKI